MFRFVSVSKSYGGKLVLNSVNLEVLHGKTTALIGPSGSGKSTLLSVMTGLLKPDQGEVFFEGVPVAPAHLKAIRLRMGYVIQDGGLFPHLTGLQNVTLMARYLRWAGDAINHRAKELSDLARLSSDLLARYPAEMSGGQKQRVSLMRALMLDPEVLLLDEPLGALDPMVRRELQDDLIAIFRHLNKTVIFVTHDLGEAAFFADRMLLMRDGRVVQEGSADDLLHRPAEPFVTQFVKAQQVRIKPEALR